ncbi:hypothetical protein DYU11_20160 [Fibrisoma montanum]|uniref:Uncharacterized protein n=1 Tax=Fibrisoma montanum TaxID=2305895 RepID=A0A418M3M3_9BACT|nr:hypothetical protein [Fibrisoma montanum]RIV20368.1 hypothetical protein DYU11_20160 [Fibrisoma montanum]
MTPTNQSSIRLGSSPGHGYTPAGNPAVGSRDVSTRTDMVRAVLIDPFGRETTITTRKIRLEARLQQLEQQGYHRADRPVQAPETAQDERSMPGDTSASSGLIGRPRGKSRFVVCVEDGLLFATTNDAARYYTTAHLTVYDSIKRGVVSKGGKRFRWATEEEQREVRVIENN